MNWLPMLASGGLSLLSGLFGGRKEKAGYQMSPDETGLLSELWGQYRGEVPSSVTAPFVRERKDLKQRYARQAGSTGILSGLGGRLAGRQSEAVGGYKRGLLGNIGALVGGRGTQTAETGSPWGDIFGGMGGDIGFLWGLQQMLKGGGG